MFNIGLHMQYLLGEDSKNTINCYQLHLQQFLPRSEIPKLCLELWAQTPHGWRNQFFDGDILSWKPKIPRLEKRHQAFRLKKGQEREIEQS